MRVGNAGDLVLGIWEAAERRIVIRRDQLASLSRYAGAMLCEIGRSASGTLDFESELTRLLGLTAAAALDHR